MPDPCPSSPPDGGSSVETAPTRHGARQATRWVGALALWAGLGLSLGWYYTFTYYGRIGWPMPTPNACAALVLYYFSVLNVRTEIQAVHWMIVFPLSGLLWAWALWAAAPRFGATRPRFARLLLALALADLPLIAPAPWMSWIAGQTADGFAWGRMIQVALRRGFVTPWNGINPFYFTLGAAALAAHVLVCRRAFGLRGASTWRHFISAAIVLSLAACLAGAVAAVPLRATLE